MEYILNTTDAYHTHTLNTLGWELTVVNALQPENSPCRGALRHNASFGMHLFRFLEKKIPLASLKTILEVGGGLGYLMKDFLTISPELQATMLDISPYLLQKQKEALSGFSVKFREMDIFKTPWSDLDSFELVIFNENLGDFPTLIATNNPPTHETPEMINWLNRSAALKNKYSLSFTSEENINVGALAVVEMLCLAGIPYIYLSEHSCEASHSDPAFPHLNFSASGVPERISLQGHAEFTIKFSHLETIAQALGYKSCRGRYTDILPIDFNDKVRAALRTAVPLSDEQEILQQFVYDLYKYEYLVLIHDLK